MIGGKRRTRAVGKSGHFGVRWAGGIKRPWGAVINVTVGA